MRPAVLDDLQIAVFTREEFDRAWQRDADPAFHQPAPPTAIVITRHSPHDFQDRQIYVWLDDQPLGKIRYGESIRCDVEPGTHTLRVFNTLFTRTLTVDVAPGDEMRVSCGTGMPTAGWLLMIFLHVTYLRVWIERENSVPTSSRSSTERSTSARPSPLPHP